MHQFLEFFKQKDAIRLQLEQTIERKTGEKFYVVCTFIEANGTSTNLTLVNKYNNNNNAFYEYLKTIPEIKKIEGHISYDYTTNNFYDKKNENIEQKFTITI